MELTLSVVSYHKFTSGQEVVKQLHAADLTEPMTIGRSPDADWYLPDPERVISGQHARIVYSAAAFYIEDTSTNGLYVNRAVTPLGHAQRHPLQSGDLLTLGDYEIEVAVATAAETTEAVDALSITPYQHVSPMGMSAESEVAADFGIDSAIFRNLAHSAGQSRGQSTAKAVVSVPKIAISDCFIPPATLPVAVSADGEGPIPDEWDSLLDGIGSHTDSAAPASANAAIELPTTGHCSAHKHTVQAAPQQSELLAAFLTGAGISQDMLPKAGAEQWWQLLGCSFQALLSGLMATLHSRSVFKRDFRVNQTMFTQQENNPLKFSATFADAVHNLFNRNGPGFLPPLTAINQGFADIAQHEQAMMDGVDGALKGLMAMLDPEVVSQRQLAPSLLDKLNPAQISARQWRAYRALFLDVAEELAQKGASVYMDDFVRAYETSAANQQRRGH